jgi:hypothetical protein
MIFAAQEQIIKIQIMPMNEMPMETIVQIPVTLTPFRQKKSKRKHTFNRVEESRNTNSCRT